MSSANTPDKAEGDQLGGFQRGIRKYVDLIKLNRTAIEQLN